MKEMLMQIMPVFILFLLGLVLKRIKFLNKEHADLFLKVAIYVILPALIIPSFANIPLSLDLLYLPAICISIMLILGATGFMVTKFFSLSNKTKGTFIMSTMIMNLSFVLVFFLAVAGPENIAYFLLFNFGHDLLLFTFIYWIACRYGQGENTQNNTESKNIDISWKKLLTLPPLWGMMIGLLINLLQMNIPVVINSTFTLLGNIFIPLVMLALGIHFSIKIKRPLLLSLSILIRMAGGLALGIAFVWLFSLEGIARFVVLIACAAPVGFNTLVFSSVEDLDKDLAAQLVSVALLLGLFVLPIVLYFIQ